jgi:glycerophosphoryl diester phosphodiesterase
MGWSLGYSVPEQPQLIDEFLLAVGKCLYLASAFEEKCKCVLRVAKIAATYEEHGDASAAMVLAKAMKDKYLAPTITDMRAFFQAEDIAVLERAKDARNFIAHESANIGPLHDASAQHIHERLARLRTELEALAAGDNLVSAWVYEIEEKGPAPRGIKAAYPNWLKNWVFGGIDRFDYNVERRGPGSKGIAGLKERLRRKKA